MFLLFVSTKKGRENKPFLGVWLKKRKRLLDHVKFSWKKKRRKGKLSFASNIYLLNRKFLANKVCFLCIAFQYISCFTSSFFWTFYLVILARILKLFGKMKFINFIVILYFVHWLVPLFLLIPPQRLCFQFSVKNGCRGPCEGVKLLELSIFIIFFLIVNSLNYHY